MTTLETEIVCCFFFVDDTDLIQSGPSVNTTGEQVFATMQNVLDHWEGLLHTTGGALAPEKSYWHLIDFKWNRATLQWNYRPKSDMPGDLSIENHDFGGGQNINCCLDIHKACKALGRIRHDGISWTMNPIPHVQGSSMGRQCLHRLYQTQ